jgi:UDP-N-acetylmuramate--alanine ligase
LSKIENRHKKLTQNKNLVKDIKNSSAKVVVMLGAGDIGVLINRVTKELSTTLSNEI